MKLLGLSQHHHTRHSMASTTFSEQKQKTQDQSGSREEEADPGVGERSCLVLFTWGYLLCGSPQPFFALREQMHRLKTSVHGS